MAGDSTQVVTRPILVNTIRDICERVQIRFRLAVIQIGVHQSNAFVR
jgi:hypothetical protein